MPPGHPTAWVTGAAGLIGSYLLRTVPASPWRIRALTRDQLDLTDFSAVRREFQKDQPKLVIHCAAIAAIADAQRNPDVAKKTNVEATRVLAELAADGQFIFFSSDLVFDGRKGRYVETDPVNPITFYGETKVMAEEIVRKNPRHLVVRTSINGGISRRGNHGFNEQLKAMLQKEQKMVLFTDEFRCPVFAGETARAVWELAAKNATGILHVAGAERLSRWQIGQLLVQRWPGLGSKIEPGSAKDFAGPPRAPDTSLDISKVQKVLSRPLPGLSAWLEANPEEPF
jgi:dTDP-4-dehydrorhamnose reductase